MLQVILTIPYIIFAKIDKAFDEDNKSLVVECVNNFVKNSDQKFNAEYGKAKDQLESLLKFKNKNSISKCRVTTYDIFNGFGVSEQKIFEYLTSEALKVKYPYVLDVIVCAPGKLRVPITGQNNHILIWY